MNDKDLFRIIDACQPTKAQIKKYYDLISGKEKSPFDLIFIKDGQQIITRRLKKDLGEVIGIIIDDTIFYAYQFCNELVGNDGITRQDVINAAAKRFPDAKVLKNKDKYHYQSLKKMRESLLSWLIILTFWVINFRLYIVLYY